MFHFLISCVLLLDPQSPSVTEEHRLLGEVLAAIVLEDGRVDYPRLKRDQALRAKLDAYVAALDTINPLEIEGPAARAAVFANAYNAITLKGVIDTWPIGSVRDIKPLFGFFTQRIWPVGGREISLNQIEKQWLRPIDPGIHFLINCASESCPALAPTPFTAQDVRARMDSLAVAFINDETKNRFEGDTWHLSKIFEWYEDDFGGRDAVIAYIIERKPELKKMAPKDIKYLRYDWSLNGPTQ